MVFYGYYVQNFSITQRSHYYDSWSNFKKNVVYSVSLAEEFYTFCWVFKKDILLQNGGYPEFFKFICNIEYVLFEPRIRSLIIDD